MADVCFSSLENIPQSIDSFLDFLKNDVAEAFKKVDQFKLADSLQSLNDNFHIDNPKSEIESAVSKLKENYKLLLNTANKPIQRFMSITCFGSGKRERCLKTACYTATIIVFYYYYLNDETLVKCFINAAYKHFDAYKKTKPCVCWPDPQFTGTLYFMETNKTILCKEKEQLNNAFNIL